MLKNKHIDKQTISISYKDARYYLLLLLSFLLPINEKISTILIIINVLLALIEIKNFKNIKYAYPLFIFFILYSFAYYRDSYEFGIKIFEQKASFIAMPIIFGTLKMSKDQIINILKAFMYGCLVICIISILYAFFRSFEFNPFRFYPYSASKGVQDITLLHEFPLQTNHFLGNNFAINMQTLYAGMYYIFALIIFYLLTIKSKINILFIILIFISAILVFSEMTLLTLSIFSLLLIKTKIKKNYYIILSMLILISILFIGRNRITNLQKSFKTDNIEEQNRYLIRVNERLAIWNSINNIDKKKLILGLGHKKAQKELNRKYELGGYYVEPILKKKLNAHNGYIQTIIETGLIGVILLIFMFTQLYRKIKKYNDKKIALVAYSFIILILINLLTESMLNKYLGISFILFFYSLFMFSVNQEQTINKN